MQDDSGFEAVFATPNGLKKGLNEIYKKFNFFLILDKYFIF
jgi:hypothetical protein